jgi:hypothetical protein
LDALRLNIRAQPHSEKLQIRILPKTKADKTECQLPGTRLISNVPGAFLIAANCYFEKRRGRLWRMICFETDWTKRSTRGIMS